MAGLFYVPGISSGIPWVTWVTWVTWIAWITWITWITWIRSWESILDSFASI